MHNNETEPVPVPFRRVSRVQPSAIPLDLSMKSRDSMPSAMQGFSERLVFRLTHLDGKPLPVPYTDPRGRHTLTSGDLTLDPDGSLWLELDLVPDPKPTVVPEGREMLVQSYRGIGSDRLEFPAGEEGMEPEFFGRRTGRDLVIVAKPLAPPAFSIAREQGGVHEWRFTQK